MDRLTDLVNTAHRRLRLRRMLLAIERNPKLLEEDHMATPFLQGLTKAIDMLEHDLEADAQGLTTKIQSVGQRGKAAMAKGHARIDGVASRVAEVDKFVTALEGANGGDPLDDSSGTSEKSDVVEPEKLTTNGVSVG